MTDLATLEAQLESLEGALAGVPSRPAVPPEPEADRLAREADELDRFMSESDPAAWVQRQARKRVAEAPDAETWDDFGQRFGRERIPEFENELSAAEAPYVEAVRAAKFLMGTDPEYGPRFEDISRSVGNEQYLDRLREVLTSPDFEKVLPEADRSVANAILRGLGTGAREMATGPIRAAAAFGALGPEMQQQAQFAGQVGMMAQPPEPVYSENPLVSDIQKGAVGAARSAGPMLGAGMLGMAAAPAAQMGVQTAYWAAQMMPDEYAKLRDEGFDDETARAAATVSALAQGAVENIIGPMEALLPKGLRQKASGSAIRKMREFVVDRLRAVGGETGEEFLQDAISAYTSEILTYVQPEIDNDLYGRLEENFKRTPEYAATAAMLMAPGASVQSLGIGADVAMQGVRKASELIDRRRALPIEEPAAAYERGAEEGKYHRGGGGPGPRTDILGEKIQPAFTEEQAAQIAALEQPTREINRILNLSGAAVMELPERTELWEQLRAERAAGVTYPTEIVPPSEVTADEEEAEEGGVRGGGAAPAEEVREEEPAPTGAGGEVLGPASVPTMITRAMREQLRQRGLTDEDIGKLTPQEAWDKINEPPAAPAEEPTEIEHAEQDKETGEVHGDVREPAGAEEGEQEVSPGERGEGVPAGGPEEVEEPPIEEKVKKWRERVPKARAQKDVDVAEEIVRVEKAVEEAVGGADMPVDPGPDATPEQQQEYADALDQWAEAEAARLLDEIEGTEAAEQPEEEYATPEDTDEALMRRMLGEEEDEEQPLGMAAPTPAGAEPPADPRAAKLAEIKRMLLERARRPAPTIPAGAPSGTTRRPPVGQRPGRPGGALPPPTGEPPGLGPTVLPPGPSGPPDVEGTGKGPQGVPEPRPPRTGTTGDAGVHRPPGPELETPKPPKPGAPQEAGRPAGRAGRVADHVIEPEHELAPTNDVERAHANVEAMRVLHRLEKENRQATPDEKRILARYAGWGSASQAFDRRKGEAMLHDWPGMRDENWEKKWGELYKTLKEELTPQEWDAARESTRYAHFTSREVVNAMWKMARQMGFEGGTALEPAAGIGHFKGLMPADLAEKTEFIGSELDPISAKVLQTLYPASHFEQVDFQELDVPNNSIDLPITNVPFAQDQPPDARARYKRGLNTHNYFIARMIDAAKPGRLIITVTSSHTMDSAIDQRRFLAGKADLVAAIRLPNTAFFKNAGTQVTTDILILRKPDNTEFKGESWIDVGDVRTIEGDTFPINEYFVRHPEMMLGLPSSQGSMHAPKPGEERKMEFTLAPHKEVSLEEQLAKVLERLPGNIVGSAAGQQIDKSELRRSELKPGTVVERDGRFKIVNDQGKLVDAGEVEPKVNVSKNKKRVQAFINLRDHYQAHIDLSGDPATTEAQFTESLQKLNTLYGRFLKDAGPINGRDNRFLEFDNGYWALTGLEEKKGVRDKKGKIREEYVPGAALRERTIYPSQPAESADSPLNAMRASLSWYGNINLPYIGKLLNLTEDEAKAKLLEEGLAFVNPANGLLESKERYVGGNVRQKLAEAKKAAKTDPAFNRNVEALEKTQPETVAPKHINFRLGSAWIPAPVVQRFVRKLLESPDATVHYSEATDVWRVEGVDRQGAASRIKWGIEPKDNSRGRSGHKLILDALNLNKPVIKKTIPNPNDPSKDIEVPDEGRTALARAKLEEIQAEFERWARADEKVIKPLQDAYNEAFNFWAPYSYDGSHLELPGLSKHVNLRPYQKNVIWRLLQDGYGMLAHAVGSGKTLVMIATAMEMRRLGLARKPMIVVQKATLGQFAAKWREMYPGANILVATAKDFEKHNRKRMMARIAAGNWDGVLMAQSQFDKLRVSPKFEIDFIQELVAQLEQAIADAEEAEGKKSSTVKQLVARLKRFKDRLKKLRDSIKDRAEDVLPFENLGVDQLFIDEAHAYKKPPFATKLKNLVGLNPDPSVIATSTMMKLRTIQNRRNGRGAILATGTPITNTLGEAWHMQNMVAPHLLTDFNLGTFDRFISTLALTGPLLTQNAAGRLVYKEAIKRFVNGALLHSFLRSAWDVLTPSELRNYLQDQGGLPKIKGGKPELVLVEKSRPVKEIFDWLLETFDQWQALSGKQKREYLYIPGLIYQLGRAASIDTRLVHPDAPDDPGSKVNVLVKKALDIYEKSTPVSGVQFIFSDQINKLNTETLEAFAGGKPPITIEEDEEEEAEEEEGVVGPPDGDLFLFKDIKRKLIEAGVPEGQIAIINDYKTDDKRLKLFESANRGEVRFLLGSTGKLGTGVNAQQKAVAVHHLDAPWMPTGLEQRNGRALRWGNDNEEIEIITYGMVDTLDASIWDKLHRKAGQVEQAMSGKLGHEFDDPAGDASLNTAETYAAMAGSAAERERLELTQNIRLMKLEKEAHYDSVARRREELEKLGPQVEGHQRIIAELKEDIEAVPKETEFKSGELDGKTYTDRKELAAAVDAKFEKANEGLLEAAKKSGERGWDLTPDRPPAKVEFKVNGLDVMVYGGPDFENELDTEGKKTGKKIWGLVRAAIVQFENKGRIRTLGRTESKTANSAIQAAIGSHEKLEQRLKVAEAELARIEGLAQELRDAITKGWPREAELSQAEQRLKQVIETLAEEGKAKTAAGAAKQQTKGPKQARIMVDEKGVRWEIQRGPYTQDGIKIVLAKALDGPDRGTIQEIRWGRLSPEEEGGASAIATGYGKLDIPVEMDPLPGKHKPISQDEIIEFMARVFNVPIHIGRVWAKKAAAAYLKFQKFAPHVIRVWPRWAGHLGVIAHEVAHHIDNMNRPIRKSAPTAAIDELKKLDYDPVRGDEKEGFAEFVRHWLTRDDADKIAPEFHKHFTTQLAANPDLKSKLDQTRAFIDTWREQGAEARAKARIHETRAAHRKLGETMSEATGRNVKEFNQSFAAAWLDRFHAAYHLAERRRRSGRAPKDQDQPGETLFELLSAYASTVPSQAMNALAGGVHRVDEAGFLEKLSQGLPEILKPLKTKEYEDWRMWAWARHAREVWAKNTNVDPGMSKEDADYIYEKHKNDRFEQAAQGLTDFNNALVKMLAYAGVLEHSEAKAMIDYWKTYMPLERVHVKHPLAAMGVKSERLVKPSKPIKKRRGADLPILDPLLATMTRAQRFYDRALKQQAMERLVKELETTEGGADFAHRVPPGTKVTSATGAEVLSQLKRELEDAGYPLDWDNLPDELLEAQVKIFRPDYRTYDDQPVQEVNYAGKRLLYHFDPYMHKMVQGISEDAMSTFLDITLGLAASIFKSGATGTNVSFAAANMLVRDPVAYIMQTDQDWLDPKTWYKPASLTFRYVNTMRAHLQGRKGDPIVELWLAMGGDVQTLTRSFGTSSGKQALKELIADTTVKRIKARATSPEAWVNTFADLVQVSEVGPRLAEFEAVLRKRGYSIDRIKRGDIPPRKVMIEAFNASRDVTTPFTRAGHKGKKVNRWTIGYLNAAIQSIDKFIRTWRKHPKRTTLRVAALFALTFMYWLWNKDDEGYRNDQWWLKYGFWNIRGSDGRVLVRLPRQAEWGGLISGFFEMMLNELVGGSETNDLKMWGNYVLQKVVPGVELPIVWPTIEAIGDYDYFRQKTIDDLQDQKKRAWERYEPWTTETAKFLGWATGWSPKRIEHWLEGVTGGSYGHLVKPLENVLRLEMPWYDWTEFPLTRGFTVKREYTQSVADFYVDRDKARMNADDSPENDDHRWKLDSIGDLMADIRKLIPEGTRDRDERFEYEKYIVGLSLFALDRTPTDLYPNPLDEGTPGEVGELAHQWLRNKVLTVTDPRPEKPESVEEWEASRRRARDMLDSAGLSYTDEYRLLNELAHKNHWSKATIQKREDQLRHR